MHPLQFFRQPTGFQKQEEFIEVIVIYGNSNFQVFSQQECKYFLFCKLKTLDNRNICYLIKYLFIKYKNIHLLNQDSPQHSHECNFI